MANVTDIKSGLTKQQEAKNSDRAMPNSGGWFLLTNVYSEVSLGKLTKSHLWDQLPTKTCPAGRKHLSHLDRNKIWTTLSKIR